MKPMTTQVIVSLILIGLLAGILSVLCGFGGGIIMLPLLFFFLFLNKSKPKETSWPV